MLDDVVGCRHFGKIAGACNELLRWNVQELVPACTRVGERTQTNAIQGASSVGVGPVVLRVRLDERTTGDLAMLVVVDGW